MIPSFDKLKLAETIEISIFYLHWSQAIQYSYSETANKS